MSTQLPSTLRLAFIGAGNMATAIIGGLLEQGVKPEQIAVSNPHPDKLAALAEQKAVQTYQSNVACIQQADVVLLCVKPQVLASVLDELAIALSSSTHQPLIISIAAGVRIPAMLKRLPVETRLIRAMPNTPTVIGLGVTALFAHATASETDKSLAQTVFSSVGDTLWVDAEAQMDVVTAVSGSGPAYVYALMESMVAAASKQGLSEADASLLVKQTFVGASTLARQSCDDLSRLREQVTSPGGTTAAGLAVLQSSQLNELMQQVIAAATARGQALGAALSDSLE